MFRRLITIFAVAAACAAVAPAQSKPNFAGTWKLNVAKSDFGVLPGPESRIDKVEQTASSLTDSISDDGPQGKRNYVLAYSLDGKESVNSPGGTEIKSVAAWEGAGLTVNSKLKYQDSDVEIKSIWTVSDDGKTLTMNSHLTSQMGETDQKLIFEKQDGAVDASALAPAPAPAKVTPAPAALVPSGAAPNLSGTWKLNVSKSDFGVLPGPESRTDRIEHANGSLKDVVDAVGPDGKQAYTLTYTTDGKEVVNTPGGLEVKSHASWEGPALVVNSKLKFQENDVEVKSIYTLSADGKTLTVNSHLSSAMGETDQKLIFEKQEGGAGD
jgi:hypothetical protein